jgi:hypothetical protein
MYMMHLGGTGGAQRVLRTQRRAYRSRHSQSSDPPYRHHPARRQLLPVRRIGSRTSHPVLKGASTSRATVAPSKPPARNKNENSDQPALLLPAPNRLRISVEGQVASRSSPTRTPFSWSARPILTISHRRRTSLETGGMLFAAELGFFRAFRAPIARRLQMRRGLMSITADPGNSA